MSFRPDITVGNLGELATVWINSLQEGANAWVASEGDYWTLEKNSGAAVGANVIAPLSGAPSAGALNARWLRQIDASGLTQLTGDVTAGPGTGSVAASVVRLQGRDVSSTAPSANGQVLTWNAGTSKWEAQTPSGGTPTTVNVTYEVGEFTGISVGDAVYVSDADNKVYKVRANTTSTRNAVGISNSTYALGATATITVVGLATLTGLAPTAGRNYFVGDSGGLTTAVGVGSGNMLIFVGVGYSATQILVNLRDYGTKP